VEFLDLMERQKRTAAKSELYPLSYGGIGNYPPAYLITNAADAITYFDEDERLFKTNDARPFQITKINGTIIAPKGHGMPGEEVPQKPHGMPGEEREPKETSLPGRIVPFSSWVKLVTKPKLLDPTKEPSQAIHPWPSVGDPNP